MSDAIMWVRIKYPVKEPEKYTIETNLKGEYIEEILSDYLRSIMGAGEDNSPAEIKDVYEINIDLDLENDSFSASSNTGNKGLRDGIVMDVLDRMSKAGPGAGSRYEIAKKAMEG